MTTATQKTIEDFGDQWTRFTENDGYYGSTELLQDIFGPLLDVSDLENKDVAEIGSGTGRIVNMLVAGGVKSVLAIEPSAAFDVLEVNTRQHGGKVKRLRARGEAIPAEPGFDLIFSIGVLHHIPDPTPVVSAARRALRPGGRMLIWLYGREGNESYLSLVQPLRRLTTRLPHGLLLALSWILNLLIWPYVKLCKWFSLPLAGYFSRVFGEFDLAARALVIYDQLNPECAKYYCRQEAIDLLEKAGFVNIDAHHRHGYSWTVIGSRADGGGPR